MQNSLNDSLFCDSFPQNFNDRVRQLRNCELVMLNEFGYVLNSSHPHRYTQTVSNRYFFRYILTLRTLFDQTFELVDAPSGGQASVGAVRVGLSERQHANELLFIIST
jgi:DNA replication protein DnaC